MTAIDLDDENEDWLSEKQPKTAAERVAARFAMEFPTDDALKSYLEEHPGADRENHWVKKDSDPPASPVQETKKDSEPPAKHDESAPAKHVNPHLTGKARQAVNDYAASGYLLMNQYLKNPSSFDKKDGDAQRKKVEALNAALAKAPKSPGTVLRGATLPTSLLVKYIAGAYLTTASFWSTTTSPEAATEFSKKWKRPRDGQASVVLHIKQKSGVSLEGATSMDEEKEILITPKTNFHIDEHRVEGKVHHVYLSEIP